MRNCSQCGISFEMTTVTMAQARKMARDEIEIDDNDNPKMSAADFSQGEDGCWVRAWVWVPNIDVEGAL